MVNHKALIIGGGPAGLAVAHTLCEHGIPNLILEKDTQLGGLSKTVAYRGFLFDIGGHRFFTKNQEVKALWEQTLGSDFLVRTRLSRIFYRDKFFHYPLRIGNALAGLGPYYSLRVALSYFKARVSPIAPEISFADWVSNRFGQVLFSIFFKTYTEKVWGIPCTQLSADWAAQRIRNLSLTEALLSALGVGKNRKVASLIEEFHYPRLGPGQMYDAMACQVKQQGGEVIMGQNALEIHHSRDKITSVTSRGFGESLTLPASHFFSSMPITELVQRMKPLAPDAVITAARALRYRSILTVNLILEKPVGLPDNWIYLHEPEIRAGRLQIFQNWSPFMVPEDGLSTITFEYFCFEGDELWNMNDGSLITLAKEDLARLGQLKNRAVLDGCVIRYAKAYPVYEDGHHRHLSVIKGWLAQFSNLDCIGRYGQFRYNNMDHSIMTGILAARRMLGEDVNPWLVNAEAEYLE
jgi:protoporphyrinogen oxidase